MCTTRECLPEVRGEYEGYTGCLPMNAALIEDAYPYERLPNATKRATVKLYKLRGRGTIYFFFVCVSPMMIEKKQNFLL